MKNLSVIPVVIIISVTMGLAACNPTINPVVLPSVTPKVILSTETQTVVPPTEIPTVIPATATATATLTPSPTPIQITYKDLSVCFPQMSSENGWRAANTASMKETAKALGIKLVYSNAQGSQKNQISAIQACIKQGVNVIALPPVVPDGWDDILMEAYNANIPVIIMDRKILGNDSLYAAHIGSDLLSEGKKAGEEMNKLLPDGGNIVELSGIAGVDAAYWRAAGFRESLNKNITIMDSQTGKFNRKDAFSVMNTFLKKYKGEIDAVYAHNDDMAVGVVQAMKTAGLKPGQTKIVSVDGTREGFQLLVTGWVQAEIECNPMMGQQVMEMALNILNGKQVDVEVNTNETVFHPEEAKALLPTRKY